MSDYTAGSCEDKTPRLETRLVFATSNAGAIPMTSHQIATSNQVVVDLDEHLPMLNPYVSPFITFLDKCAGRKHEPTEWELIGEGLIELNEIYYRLRQMGV